MPGLIQGYRMYYLVYQVSREMPFESKWYIGGFYGHLWDSRDLASECHKADVTLGRPAIMKRYRRAADLEQILIRKADAEGRGDEFVYEYGSTSATWYGDLKRRMEDGLLDPDEFKRLRTRFYQRVSRMHVSGGSQNEWGNPMCRCGIYMRYSPRNLLWEYGCAMTPIIAHCTAWGKVALCEMGIRASNIRIEHLYVPDAHGWFNPLASAGGPNCWHTMYNDFAGFTANPYNPNGSINDLYYEQEYPYITTREGAMYFRNAPSGFRAYQAQLMKPDKHPAGMTGIQERIWDRREVYDAVSKRYGIPWSEGDLPLGDDKSDEEAVAEIMEWANGNR